MVALAEDHLNDIFSNVAAAATAVIAKGLEGAWWTDGVGAILISLYILWRWLDIAKGQVWGCLGDRKGLVARGGRSWRHPVIPQHPWALAEHR